MDRKRQGEIAELAFMHMAMERGFAVSKPYGDSTRYDFIVEGEGKLTRVQVKSTSQLFQGGYFLNAQRRLNWGVCPYDQEEVDVIAAYVTPENAWYVIPVAALKSRKSLRVYPHRPTKDWKWGRFRERWELLRNNRRQSGSVFWMEAAVERHFTTEDMQRVRGKTQRRWTRTYGPRPG